MKISSSTADRYWVYARAWLYRRLAAETGSVADRLELAEDRQTDTAFEEDPGQQPQCAGLLQDGVIKLERVGGNSRGVEDLRRKRPKE